MSILDKVFNVLVVEGREASAKQMATWFGTTPNSIASRVSELRCNEGFAIYANKRTDSNGRTTTFYRRGTPARAVVAAGYRALAAA
jgi:predicted ArsR family transcriptional regulator